MCVHQVLPNPNRIDYGYNEFLSGIDTIIIGRKTYEDVLGFKA
jgi:dihydrofolate reductase